jgi:hypothetical protein
VLRLYKCTVECISRFNAGDQVSPQQNGDRRGTGISPLSAARVALSAILRAPSRRVAATLKRHRLSRELSCIEPRLRVDAGIDPEQYLRG